MARSSLPTADPESARSRTRSESRPELPLRAYQPRSSAPLPPPRFLPALLFLRVNRALERRARRKPRCLAGPDPHWRAGLRVAPISRGPKCNPEGSEATNRNFVSIGQHVANGLEDRVDDSGRFRFR